MRLRRLRKRYVVRERVWHKGFVEVRRCWTAAGARRVIRRLDRDRVPGQGPLISVRLWG